MILSYLQLRQDDLFMKIMISMLFVQCIILNVEVTILKRIRETHTL